MENDSGLGMSLKYNCIDLGEIEFSGLSRVDDVGRIFFWQGRVFRAINNHAVETVKDMFSGGMLDELVRENLVPKSWITDYTLDGYGLIIEHERIHSVTYPYEWSFSMFKDAAITVLRVNIIARKYGYQLKDCHGYNVLFDCTKPKYVDLGSFVKTETGSTGWVGDREFLRYYYGALFIWGGGNYYVARSTLLNESEIMPYEGYLLYRFPLLRLISPNLLKRFADLFFKYWRISIISPARIKEKLPNVLGDLVCFLKQQKLLPFQSADPLTLIKRIQRIRKKKYGTKWGEYHNEYYNAHGEPVPSPRFDRIINIVKSYDIGSVLEVGGNQGAFSRLLLERTKVEHVICTDYDENAVDLMYQVSRDQNPALTPAVMDFIVPVITYFGKYPYERFKSDAVMALAVVHHLVLTQNIPIDQVFKTLSAYSKRYIFIEYMPLGLYNGKNIPSVPTWYTQDWFRQAFEKYFKVLLVEKLEENRILFVGELNEPAILGLET